MSGWQEPRFDNHAFANRRTKAVSATTHLSFQDMNKMHVDRRKERPDRRLPTPEWSVVDSTTRETVLRFCEARLFIRSVAGLTDSQRMQQIKAAEQRMLPTLEKNLETLQGRYASETDPRKRELLVPQIQNMDTQIILARRSTLAMVTSVAYRYYRLGENSVQIAQALGVKSPMVRMWLFRLNNLVKYPVTMPSLGVRRYTKEDLLNLFALRNQGKSWVECAKVLNYRPEYLANVWRKQFGDLRTKQAVRYKLRNPDCKPRRKWTPERLQHLFVLRATRHTFRQCGRTFGMSGVAVRNVWNHYFGVLRFSVTGKAVVAQIIPPGPRGRRRVTWTNDKIKRLAYLRAGGATFAAIAKDLGLSRPQCAQAAYTRYTRKG